MAQKDAERKPLPPYIPYRTFQGLIRKLNESTIPDQIDLSVLRSYSNSMARQIIASLKYLKLIDSSGKTTEQLRKLVGAYDTKEWPETLMEAFFDVYDPLLSGLNLDSATPRQLEEKFRNAGADGQMLQKCLAFFVSAAADAGVLISPHITNRPRKARAGKGRGRPKKSADDQDETNIDFGGAGSIPGIKGGLLVKFQFPIPEKGNATILIPANVTEDDWEMISTMMKAYVGRLGKK